MGPRSMSLRLVETCPARSHGSRNCQGCENPHGPYVNTLYDDGFGFVHFCEACVRAIAAPFGLVSPEEHAAVVAVKDGMLGELAGRVEAFEAAAGQRAEDVDALASSIGVKVADRLSSVYSLDAQRGKRARVAAADVDGDDRAPKDAA